ncbi:MAG: general secretion pathway protein GspK [Victivallales bacterium]|jgi:hypothetical protein|nr:general secretion pathway protein GspK [Victivallales bacterium]
MKQSESGSALVVVLCLIFMASMLAMAVLAMSKYNTFTIQAHLDLQRSFYVNEGVANRIQYLIAADRSLFPMVQLGKEDYGEYDHDRFLADGVIHRLNYYGTPIEFTISDVRSGFDLSSGNYANTLQRIANSDMFDQLLHDTIDQLSAVISDYIDSNDEISLNGFESADYEALNMEPLPRNGNIEFREELSWIPGVSDLFPSDKSGRMSSIRLIGSNVPRGTPSIFTADRLILKTYCNLEEEEIDVVIAALEVYRRERILLNDQLDELIAQKLTTLSWQESGSYTVTISGQLTEIPDTVAFADQYGFENRQETVRLPTSRPSYRLTFSYPGFGVSGPSENMVRYMEWMFH